jgi:PhnB protein
MTIKQLNPYLSFEGTAGKAIELYERALGAQTESLQRFGDVPGVQACAEDGGRVMHAVLRLGPAIVMISDSPPGVAVPAGDNVQVCLDFDDEQDMVEKFGALADGGKITMPLQDTFWGAKFGMLTDAYGISWMFNCTLKPG